MSYDQLLEIMSGQDRTLAGGLSRLGLSILEPVYRGIVGIRNRMFDSGLRKPKKLPRPVISVGNLTAGGTGKTPMVIELVKRLKINGVQPAVLLRGYRAGDSGSDEAAELQNELGSQVAVAANPDRSAGAKLALESQPGTDVFVLDDGFQHRQVARELDIVLVDATQPWGFGHVLPRGLLRENKAGLHSSTGLMTFFYVLDQFKNIENIIFLGCSALGGACTYPKVWPHKFDLESAVIKKEMKERNITANWIHQEGIY